MDHEKPSPDSKIVRLDEYRERRYQVDPEKALEDLEDCIIAASVMSMWAHPRWSAQKLLGNAAEGLTGSAQLDERVAEILTDAIEREVMLSEEDRLYPAFQHSYELTGGDFMQTQALAHTEILYAVSQSDPDKPQDCHRQTFAVLRRIVHAYDTPPPKPRLRPLN